MSSSDSCEGDVAALCRLQNCMQLVASTGLTNVVHFKVYKQPQQDRPTRFLVVVSVSADAAFYTYYQTASNADLPLFRGMLLTLSFPSCPLPEPVPSSTRALQAALPPSPPQSLPKCSILQAFLPKFDIRRQDRAGKVDVAQVIQSQAAQRFMMVSVKHSGSLSTLSGELMTSKNGVGTAHAAAALLLLQAHYARVSATSGDSRTPASHVEGLRAALTGAQASVSFETMTRCMGHHGQQPAGEYLVATAMTLSQPDATLQVADWTALLEFCLQHHLPVNDTWIIWGDPAASAASAALQKLTFSAATTCEAVAAIDNLMPRFPGSFIKVPGTYPHAEWQGSRIEGFVVAQGEPVSDAAIGRFRKIAEQMRGRQMRLARFVEGASAVAKPQASVTFVEQALAYTLKDDVDDGCRSGSRQHLQAAVTASAPDMLPLLGNWEPCKRAEADAVMSSVREATSALELRDHIFAAQHTGAAPSAVRPPDQEAPAASQSRHETSAQNVCPVVSRRALDALEATHISDITGLEEGQRRALLDLVRQRTAAADSDVAAGAVAPAAAPTPEGVNGSAPGAAPAVAGSGASRAETAVEVPGDAATGGPGAAADMARVAPVEPSVATAARTRPRRDQPPHSTMRALCSALHVDNALRYKVKMWMFRKPQAASGDTAAAAAAATPAVSGAMADDGGADETSDAVKPPHVGYCMMTMILRNGLSELKRGRHELLAFAQRTAQLAGMSEAHVSGVVAFADAWHAWASAHAPDVIRGGASLSERYLDFAEHFVSSFLAGGPVEGAAGSGRLRGILVMVGFEGDVVARVAERLGANVADNSTLRWSRTLAVSGTVISLLPWSGSVSLKGFKDFWPAAAADLMIVHRPLPHFKALAGDEGPEQKRLTACSAVALRQPLQALRDHCRKDGRSEGRRILEVSTPQWAPARIVTDPEAPPSATGGGPAAMAAATSLTASMTNGAAPTLKRDAPDTAAAGEEAAEVLDGKKAVIRAAKQQRGDGGQAGAGCGSGRRAGRASGARPRPAAVPEMRAWAGAAAADALVEEVVQWAGTGVQERPQDSAVVIVFIGIPGTGKSALCAALTAQLPPARFVVEHLMSDALKPQQRRFFWKSVASAAVTQRGDGRTTVVLADKNLIDSPAGNFEAVSATLATASAPVITVFFGVHTDSDTPHGMPTDDGPAATEPSLPPMLTALCMKRVLQRCNHVGNLDGEATADALQIVNDFAAAFRGLTTERLRRRTACFGRHQCTAPALTKHPELPEVCQPLQDELVSLVHAGAEFGGFRSEKTAATRAWEVQLRECLARSDVEEMLRRFEVPMDDGVARIAHHVDAVVHSTAAQQQLRLSDCRYIAVTNLPVRKLRAAFAVAQPQAPPPCATASAKTELHATLWHTAELTASSAAGGVTDATNGDPGARREAALRHEAHGQAALAAVGSTVVLRVLGFDCSKECAAARVELVGNAEWLRDVQRPHVTMWLASHVPAKQAGYLQEHAATGGGEAVYVQLDQPLLLQGIVSAVPV